MKKIVVLILMVTCNNQEKPKIYDDWKGGFIERPGVYILADKKIEVENLEGIIKYQLLTEDQKVIFSSFSKPSVYHRWFLYWDEMENIWLYSSDIGGEVWKKDTLSTYNHSYLNVFVDTLEMPIEYFEKMKNDY